MSSTGRQIIGWRWLEERWENILPQHSGVGAWKPVVATSHRGHSTITETPLMSPNDCRVCGGRKKKSFAFLFDCLIGFFVQGISMSQPGGQSLVGQPCLLHKALLRLHATVRVLPHVHNWNHCFILTWPRTAQEEENIVKGYMCLCPCVYQSAFHWELFINNMIIMSLRIYFYNSIYYRLLP